MIKIRETIEKHMRHGDSNWSWECTTGELIRCKDCKFAHLIEPGDDWWECEHDKRVLHSDGFCSWAERKEA